jgi:hypothetical protein
MMWTDDRIEILKSFWATGLSARQIANELGGTTRNAVIGMAYRLKLPRREPSWPRSAPKRKPAAPVKLKLKPRLVASVAPPAKSRLVPAKPPRPLYQLADNQCRWVVDSREFLFCGAPIAEARRPYCPHHTRAARLR